MASVLRLPMYRNYLLVILTNLLVILTNLLVILTNKAYYTTHKYAENTIHALHKVYSKNGTKTPSLQNNLQQLVYKLK